jgi:hypothetical protein
MRRASLCIEIVTAKAKKKGGRKEKKERMQEKGETKRETTERIKRGENITILPPS